MPEVQVFSLFQLCQSIANVLKKATGSRRFWVSCEIVRVNERRGHRYIELVDMDGENEMARISAVLWATTWKNLLAQHGSDLNSILESGKKVLLECSVDFHEVYGLKLQIYNIDPLYTIGDLESKKRATLEKIQKEKLLKKNSNLHLPPVIKHIAIISSEQAAGYEDFVNHITLNTYGYGFTLMLFEAAVQGVNAEQEICSAIARAQDHDVDAIVLIRGGGSRLDLEIFNSYSIAVAIAECRIPVISGIGHESDETVADLVAHTRQKTPTAVAHFIIEINMNYESRMQWTFERIQKEAKLLLGSSNEQLNVAGERFKRMVEGKLIRESSKVRRLKDRLVNGSRHFIISRDRNNERFISLIDKNAHRLIAAQSSKLRVSKEKLALFSLRLIETEQEDLIENRKKLVAYGRQKLKQEALLHKQAASLIRLVHPDNILKKGFAIVKSEGQFITKKHDLRKDQDIQISFYTFEAEAQVKRITPKKNGKKSS